MNSVTIRNLLVRGMLAGLAAGVVALVVAYLLGEPRVDAAIAFEEAHSHDHGHEMEVVSRGMQSTAGLATGVLVYGVALGGIAALVFCFLLGRIGRFGARTTAALLAGAALLVYLVPFLKYPANPPAVGDPDTIGQRTALYFLMMLLGILLAVGATTPRPAPGSQAGQLVRHGGGRRRVRGRRRARVRLPAVLRQCAARVPRHTAVAVPAVDDRHPTGAVDRLRAALRPPRGARRPPRSGPRPPRPRRRPPPPDPAATAGTHRGRARDHCVAGPPSWRVAPSVGPPLQDRPGMPSRCGRSWSRRSRLARR